MKTQNDILTTVYKVITSFQPIVDLDGGIYKVIRPTGSNKEDCVITLTNGFNMKFQQDGGLSVKIFFKDLNENNTYFQDTKRGGELESLLYDLSVELLKNNKGLSFEIQTRETYIGRFAEENQHYAILKMNFKIAK